MTVQSRGGGVVSLVLVSFVLACCLAPAAGAQTLREKWECKLNLHQGDTGTLTISRKGTAVEGETYVTRGNQTHRISGQWNGDRVEFWRTLSETSGQHFKGITAAPSDKSAVMAGRFAANFSGIWSAECDLLDRQGSATTTSDTKPPVVNVSLQGSQPIGYGKAYVLIASAKDDTGVKEVQILVDDKVVRRCPAPQCSYQGRAGTAAGRHKFQAVALDAAGNRGESKASLFMVRPIEVAGPSLNIRATPYEPTDRDKIRFTASAGHSSGVRDVTIRVNGKVVRTCRSTKCEYLGGPYRAGTVRWRVSARSRNGGTTEGRDNTLRVKAAPATGRCSISGRATGSKAGSSSAFFVALTGPDGSTRVSKTAPFRSNRYRFSGLPEGTYRLSADTRGDLPVSVSPRQRTVTCRGSGPSNINFEFR